MGLKVKVRVTARISVRNAVGRTSILSRGKFSSLLSRADKSPPVLKIWLQNSHYRSTTITDGCWRCCNIGGGYAGQRTGDVIETAGGAGTCPRWRHRSPSAPRRPAAAVGGSHRVMSAPSNAARWRVWAVWVARLEWRQQLKQPPCNATSGWSVYRTHGRTDGEPG